MKEQMLAVQRMQDYINAHYQEEISLADLASISLFSPWYSHRLFKEYTGYAPADYIRRLRLSKSALRLRDENIKIIDVAFACGFESVDGYQRAFLREFGCNPKEYALNPIPLSLFTAFGVKFISLWNKEKASMNKAKCVFIQVLEKPAHKVLVKRGEKADNYMDYCYEVGCDIWGLLISMKSLCGEPVSLWLPKQYQKPNTSSYVQGVEVELDYQGVIPEGFDIIELPQSTYLMFQGEPFIEEDYCEAIVSVQEAMDGYDPTAIGYEWDDNQPRIQLEPNGKRGYMELRAVKKVQL